MYDVINVKTDYGAVGDGSHDDTTNIQAALDVAYGTTAVPHGASTSLNKIVFFPSGNYKITSALTLRSVRGACIIGAGRFTTKIQNVTSNGSVFITNGFEYSKVEQLQLVSNGTGVAFDLDWDGTGATALQSNTFSDIYFETGAYGLRIGNTGSMGSETLILNCFFSNFSVAGIATRNFNALQQTMIGGNIQGCAIGIWVYSGSVPTIIGTGFQVQSDTDIAIDSAANDSYFIAGCRSESVNFIRNTAGAKMNISSCSQTNSTAGIFTAFTGHVEINECISVNGKLDTTGNNNAILYGRNNNFQRSTFLSASFGGYAGDALSTGFNSWNADGFGVYNCTFSQLPAAAVQFKGAKVTVVDSTTSTWGSTITGGGSNVVLAYCNGINWTVAGK